jgi:hypothetical protein
MLTCFSSGSIRVCIAQLEQLLVRNATGSPEIDCFPVSEKLEIIDSIGNMIERHISDRQPLEDIFLVLCDLTQDCPVQRIHLLTESTSFVKPLIRIISEWKLTMEGENQYDSIWLNHSVYHSTMYILMAMVSGAEICRNFVKVFI